MELFDNFFGGFFDCNGDGKTTWDEEFIAFQIFEEMSKEGNADDNEDL